MHLPRKAYVYVYNWVCIAYMHWIPVTIGADGLRFRAQKTHSCLGVHQETSKNASGHSNIARLGCFFPGSLKLCI